MKLAIFIILFTALQVRATDVSGQTISLDVKQTEIRKILNTIEKTGQYRFLYNYELKGLKNKVDFSVNGLPLTTALDKLFAGNGLTYRLLNNNLVAVISVNEEENKAVRITGKVTGANNEALTGVSVLEKGTTNGTTTDNNGSYSLTVADNATIIISYVGYLDQEIAIAGRSVIDVTLTPSQRQMDEVVVIGYGAVRRRDLTGSVYSVKADDIVRTPTFNAIEAIQGRVPGVDITRSSGAAGSGSNILIRGTRSINGSNQPLFIIDGYQGGNINDLNVNDIQSIEVLKDASATAIYGAQGANGVVIVTTKRGMEGKTRVSYDGYIGINGVTAYPAGRLRDDYIQLRREAWRDNGWTSPADDPTIFSNNGEWQAIQNNEWIDFIDLLGRNGIQQSHTISVRGGSDKTKTYLSLGYFKEEGMLTRNDFTRYNARLNVDHKVNKWASTGISSQLTYFTQNARRDPLSAAMSIAPLGVPYDAEGNVNLYLLGNRNRLNPLTDERGKYVATDNSIATNISTFGYIELKPFKGFSFKSNLGVTLSFTRRGIFNDSTSLAQNNTKIRTASNATAFTRYLNWDNIITYTRDFGHHSVTFTGVTSYIQSDADNLRVSGNNQLLSSQLFYNIGGTTLDPVNTGSPFIGWNNKAYAARINYGYRGKYLLTLSQRWDGASRLSPGKQWDAFSSAAAAWNISSEPFMDKVAFVDNLKLRLSYGLSGNYGIDVYGTQSGVSIYPMGFGNISAPAYIFNQTVGNPNLGWEKSATANIGLDFTLFKNRLNATIDAYQTITSDILLRRTLPFSTGVTDIFQNVGETKNKGIEVAITSYNVLNKEVNWNTTLTFAKNNEKITKLINDKNIISTQSPETQSLFIGQPIRTFYTYIKQGIWQSDKAALAARYRFGSTPFKPGDIMLADLNGDSVIDANNDRTFIGSAVPDFVLGLQNNVTYKGFDLGVYFLMRWGQMINAEFLGRYNPSGEGNGPAIIDYWTPDNPTNDFPRPRRGAQLSTIAGYQTLTFVDGSFWKIKNVTLGYTFPQTISRKFYVDKLRFYATASNLFVQAKSHLVQDYDPERGGAESGPLSRQFVFGVNVDF